MEDLLYGVKEFNEKIKKMTKNPEKLIQPKIAPREKRGQAVKEEGMDVYSLREDFDMYHDGFKVEFFKPKKSWRGKIKDERVAEVFIGDDGVPHASSTVFMSGKEREILKKRAMSDYQLYKSVKG